MITYCSGLGSRGNTAEFFITYESIRFLDSHALDLYHLRLLYRKEVSRSVEYEDL